MFFSCRLVGPKVVAETFAKFYHLMQNPGEENYVEIVCRLLRNCAKNRVQGYPQRMRLQRRLYGFILSVSLNLLLPATVKFFLYSPNHLINH